MSVLTTQWRRVPVPDLLRIGSPGVRAWQRAVEDGHLSVLVGREPSADRSQVLWHLSISHRTNEARPQPGRYPTWDEIADARYRFCPDDVTMAMLLPPKSEYVNAHATTFHLWQVPGDAPNILGGV
jgi:hypothetical protein